MGVDVPKNLIYFIYYGGKITHYHRLNLSLLGKYWSVFNGKKVIKRGDKAFWGDKAYAVGCWMADYFLTILCFKVIKR